jgi:ABC-type Mn2+/Zn2+ transport system permease subunit
LTNPLYGILLALVFAVAAGLVGSFALMRRMLLAGDVISHLALPGLGLAFLVKINPLVGGAATLFIGTLIVWKLEQASGLATEAAIGVVFAGALAIGAAVTPREDLVEALFGGSQLVSVAGLLSGLAAAGFVMFFLYRFRDRLALATFSADLAASAGVNVRRLNLYFLLVFSLTVIAELRFMGALLASALLIIPAATGRQLTNKFSQFLWASSLASVLAVSVGYALNRLFMKGALPGPAVGIVAAILFGLSLLKRATA